MSDFFKSIVDDLKDEDVHVMADGRGSAEFTSYVDTGCYMLNALISGSLYGGMADNKVLAVAGESSTGKTFFALGIAKQFLDKFPTGAVLYYDTESAITKKMMENRGIDPRRVIVSEPATIQDFRTKSLKFLEKYGATPADKRPPLLIVLDSLGMLSSVKEIEDTDAGKDTRDMTKAPLIKGLFRVLRLKLAKLHVPMVVIGHTYAAIGCMIGETMVKMEGGYAVPISQIREGDVVETLVGPKPVIDTYRYEDSEVFEIETEDGSVLTVTDRHKFLTQEMVWKTVAELKEGDTIVSLSSSPDGVDVASLQSGLSGGVSQAVV